MASPQKENGWTSVSNELAEAFAMTYLTSQESKILWVLLRQTYGYKKTMDKISFSQFERKTGLHRRHISTVLKRLVSRNIIKREVEGQNISYGPQKDYDLWDKTITQMGNGSTIQSITQTSNTPLPEQVSKPLPERVNTIERKKVLKKKKISLPSLPAELSDIKGFTEVWNDWILFRKEIKKPLTPTAIKIQFNKLIKFKAKSHDIIQIINTSIERRWQGLFEPTKIDLSYRNNGHKETLLDDY